jgi:uncharacterized protein YukE
LVVGGSFDAMMLADQDKLDAEAAKSAPPPSSGSSATAGFRNPSLHISSFPPGSGGGSGFRVDPSQLNNVSGAMGSDANSLQNSVSTLNGNGSNAGLIAAGWATTDNLAVNASNAYVAITGLTQKLQQAYEDVRANLHRSAQNYSDADDASASAANQVGNEAG